MRTYHIRRNVPGLGQEDIDAAAFRALVCATEFENLRWVRSYWDRDAGAIFCIYEAASRELVIEHARRARIPCDEVYEVQVVLPGDYAESISAPVAAAG
jgi:hypothetical protein